jgi:hypothetical protein
MLTFSRQNYSELWIRIIANESLGILQTDRVEDYFGVDGQLTLHNVTTDSRTPILMAEDVTATPSIAHDVFEGMVDLTTTPDGLYTVEGRVKDSLGNYRILSSVQSPLGDEDITLFEITITPAEVVVRLPKEGQIVEAFSSHSLSVMVVSGNMGISVQAVGKEFSVSTRSYEMEADINAIFSTMEGSIEESDPIEADVIDVYSVS